MCPTSGIFCLLCLSGLGVFLFLRASIHNQQVIFKDDNDIVVLADGFDKEQINRKTVLMQKGRVKWILDNCPDRRKNTQMIRKLANLFEFNDTIPKSYNVGYYYDAKLLNDSAVAFVNFGISSIKFIDDLKVKSGALKLSSVRDGLKSKQEIDEFLRKCDTLSFQRIVLFMVLIGYGDMSADNIMLQYSEATQTIKFVLIDYEHAFQYVKPTNKELFNSNDRLSVKLLTKVDCQLPQINESINKIKTSMEGAKEIFGNATYDLFKSSVNNFLDNYGMGKFEEYVSGLN